MFKNRPITDHLAEDRASISVEFFPPKDEAGGEAIMQTAQEIRDHVQPDFVSITYGAGGTTRERTFRYANLLKDECGLNVMPHLTCVGSSNEEVVATVQEYVDAGFCNFMVLRGDPPKGDTAFKPHPNGPRYGSDLVRLLRQNFAGLCLGVGGYPETHPEAPSPADDIERLKFKVDQGASFVTTQLFFNNANFIDFAKRCKEIGIQVPLVPGLMPVFNAKTIRRFCDDIPEQLSSALERAGEDREAQQAVGLDWAYQQTVELLEFGSPGVHFYIMNRSKMVVELVKRLRANGVI